MIINNPCCGNYPPFVPWNYGSVWGWRSHPKSSNTPPSPQPPWQRAQQSPLVQVITENDTVNIDMDTTYLSSVLATQSAAGSIATSDGLTATFTTSSPHGLNSGQVVAIAGALNGFFDGVQTITVTGPSTFTYPITGSAGATDPSATATFTTSVQCNLPNGTAQRQSKQIYIPGDQIAGTAVFIISGTFAGGYTKLKFSSIGFSAMLFWDSTAWQLSGGNAELLA